MMRHYCDVESYILMEGFCPLNMLHMNGIIRLHYLDNVTDHGLQAGLILILILFWIVKCMWLWNMVSYNKGGMQAKGIWEQDHEANIWAQWGVEKASQLGIS